MRPSTTATRSVAALLSERTGSPGTTRRVSSGVQHTQTEESKFVRLTLVVLRTFAGHLQGYPPRCSQGYLLQGQQEGLPVCDALSVLQYPMI